MINLLKAEALKNKYNYGMYLTILFPIVISLLVLIYLQYNYNSFSSIDTLRFNPWSFFLGRYILPIYSFLYPVIIAIFVHSVCDIEDNNNNYKLLFTLPVSRYSVCSLKITFTAIILLFSVSIAYFLFFGGGLFLSKISPNYSFQNNDSTYIIFLYFIKLFITLSAILSIQFSLSFYFKNFTVPVGFSALITFISILMLNKSSYIYLVPYYSAHSAMGEFMNETISVEKYDYINIIYVIIFLILNRYLIKNMKA